MGRSRRAERRQQKAAQKRADALARTPKMLADEQSLRDDLDALSDLASRIREHANYDQAIHARTEEMQRLAGDLTRGHEQLLNIVLRLGLRRVLPDPDNTGDDQAACREARQLLATYEGYVDRANAISSEVADMVVARANVGTRSIDFEDMAARLEKLAEHVETVEASVERFRELIDHECATGDNNA